MSATHGEVNIEETHDRAQDTTFYNILTMQTLIESKFKSNKLTDPTKCFFVISKFQNLLCLISCFDVLKEIFNLFKKLVDSPCISYF